MEWILQRLITSMDSVRKVSLTNYLSVLILYSVLSVAAKLEKL